LELSPLAAWVAQHDDDTVQERSAPPDGHIDQEWSSGS
jgi:hypothetical protein